MEHNFEQSKKVEEQAPLLEREEVRKFIQFRNIKNEDLHFIEELAAFPKNLIIEELHNLFNMNKERSGIELENLIKTTSGEERKAMYKVALDFYSKHDWMTSLNLVRVLETV